MSKRANWIFGMFLLFTIILTFNAFAQQTQQVYVITDYRIYSVLLPYNPLLSVGYVGNTCSSLGFTVGQCYTDQTGYESGKITKLTDGTGTSNGQSIPTCSVDLDRTICTSSCIGDKATNCQYKNKCTSSSDCNDNEACVTGGFCQEITCAPNQHIQNHLCYYNNNGGGGSGGGGSGNTGDSCNFNTYVATCSNNVGRSCQESDNKLVVQQCDSGYTCSTDGTYTACLKQGSGGGGGGGGSGGGSGGSGGNIDCSGNRCPSIKLLEANNQLSFFTVANPSIYAKYGCIDQSQCSQGSSCWSLDKLYQGGFIENHNYNSLIGRVAGGVLTDVWNTVRDIFGLANIDPTKQYSVCVDEGYCKYLDWAPAIGPVNSCYVGGGIVAFLAILILK